MPIFSSFYIAYNNIGSSHSLTFTNRKFTDDEINAFKLSLSSYDWQPTSIVCDVNDLFNQYMEKFSELYN